MNIELAHAEDGATEQIGPAALDARADVAARELEHLDAMIDQWGRDSFPASDPPSNW